MRTNNTNIKKFFKGGTMTPEERDAFTKKQNSVPADVYATRELGSINYFANRNY